MADTVDTARAYVGLILDLVLIGKPCSDKTEPNHQSPIVCYRNLIKCARNVVDHKNNDHISHLKHSLPRTTVEDKHTKYIP